MICNILSIGGFGPHLFLGFLCGKEDEAERSNQQRQDKHVKDEPEQIETHPLAKRPLSLTQREILLLQEQLKRHRKEQYNWMSRAGKI